MSEQNKTVIRRYIEDVVNRGDLDLVDELYAEQVMFHMPFSPEPLHGPESIKQTVAGFRTAFSDLSLKIEDLVAEDDVVVAHLTASGTNDGEMMGMPATNQPARWSLVHLITFKDGKIIEDRAFVDRMGLMEQLGHVQAAADT